MTQLRLPAAVQRQIEAQAAGAYPRECCGLLEGRRQGETVEIVAAHPARNLAAAPDRFEIDPSDHLRLQRNARAAGHAIVGCYHSHPDGRAAPSPHDRAGAAEAGFVWIVAATDGAHCTGLRAYLSDGTGFCALPLAGGTLLDPVAPERV